MICMLDLDQQFEAATGDLRERLQTVRVAPASRVIEKQRRHRRAVTLSGVLVVVAVLGALAAIVLRDIDEPVASGNDPATAQLTDSLLFPSKLLGGNTDEVMIGPQSGSGARGLVQAPDGALFIIGITERFGTELTPNTERRVFAGRTFSNEGIEKELAYVAVDDCMTVSVRQSHLGAQVFDSDAATLLEALSITNRSAAVTLPAGWTSFGVGNPGSLIQIAFHSTVDKGSAQFNLMQLLNTPVPALLGFAGTGLAPTSFNDQPAWSGASPFTSLAWTDGSNAALLYSDTATLDQLKQVATTLGHNHSEQFANLSVTAGGPNGTSPAPDTIAPGGSGPATAVHECGTSRLTIR